MVRHENNYSVLQYPVFSMTGPKVCITRWSATKTRTMIADDLDQIDIGRRHGFMHATPQTMSSEMVFGPHEM